MMFPVWVPLGPWQVHPHLFFEVLAYGVGFTLYLRRRRARGDHISDESRWSIVTAAAIGAVIGSRILFWLEGEGGSLGGKTVVGGILGGWLAVEVEKKRLGVQQRTEQHSCVSLVEICDFCNLRCPICYAASGPERQQFRSLDQVERMLDAVVRNEGQPDVVQISGGEPTLHPDFFRVLDLAKARPIRHLMVNTNGLKIAESEAFTERLAQYMPDFEVYLQFDSFEERALIELRGMDLRSVRAKALERLNRHGISTTLVATLKKGVNDHEIGRLIDFALEQPAVRGVTFQPIQHAGRADGFTPAANRLTLTEVRRGILQQTNVFGPEDVIPVPCHPDTLAMAYALKLGGKVTPLTGLIDPDILIEDGRNTIIFEQDGAVREGVLKLFATNHSPRSGVASLRDLLCCLPSVSVPEGLGYQNLFRVIIMQFIDAHAFANRAVMVSAADHHEVSGVKSTAQRGGSSRSTVVISLLRSQGFRRLLEVAREPRDLLHVRRLRVRREIPHLHVLEHASAKRAHMCEAWSNPGVRTRAYGRLRIRNPHVGISRTRARRSHGRTISSREAG
jgi:7,8-dihydro-6-hydroxymethylpterin dimethyltransferase